MLEDVRHGPFGTEAVDRLYEGTVAGRRLDRPRGVPEVAASRQVFDGLAKLEQAPLVPYRVAVVGVQTPGTLATPGTAALPLHPRGAVRVHSVADGSGTAFRKLGLGAPGLVEKSFPAGAAGEEGSRQEDGEDDGQCRPRHQWRGVAVA